MSDDSIMTLIHYFMPERPLKKVQYMLFNGVFSFKMTFNIKEGTFLSREIFNLDPYFYHALALRSLGRVKA